MAYSAGGVAAPNWFGGGKPKPYSYGYGGVPSLVGGGASTFGGGGTDALKAYKAQAGIGSGGGAGGAGGGVPQMPYKPQGPDVQKLIDPLAQAGQGLLDPSSAYHQRMRSELMETTGEQAGAQQRAAALRAAQAGLGGGASPELLETQADIGRSGLEGYGDAAARALLGGMELGGSMLQPAISGQLGLQGQQLQAYLAQQQGLQNQDEMRWRQAMAEQQMAQDMLLRQMSLLYGGM